MESILPRHDVINLIGSRGCTGSRHHGSDIMIWMKYKHDQNIPNSLWQLQSEKSVAGPRAFAKPRRFLNFFREVLQL
jgi:hypothetical protein